MQFILSYGSHEKDVNNMEKLSVFPNALARLGRDCTGNYGWIRVYTKCVTHFPGL